MYWLFLLFKPIFSKKLGHHQLAITCILIGFIFNASFDVFLEGPMGAFPFWTWVGLLFMSVGITDANASDSSSLNIDANPNNASNNTATKIAESSSINPPNS
jgi:hypothetical protein